jgi:hypothetical protein
MYISMAWTLVCRSNNVIHSREQEINSCLIKCDNKKKISFVEPMNKTTIGTAKYTGKSPCASLLIRKMFSQCSNKPETTPGK